MVRSWLDYVERWGSKQEILQFKEEISQNLRIRNLSFKDKNLPKFGKVLNIMIKSNVFQENKECFKKFLIDKQQKIIEDKFTFLIKKFNEQVKIEQNQKGIF